MKEYLIWLGKLVTLVVVFIVVVPLLLAVVEAVSKGDLSEKIADHKQTVAVIEVKGIIDDSREVLEELHRQVENKKVKGIVLSVNSPGGAVGPSQDIYQAVSVLKAKKPIVVSMGALAASGGLYVSLGASKILAQPGTITGSIGVILQIPNVQEVAQKVGVQMITIKSGKLKDVGNSFRQMSDEERIFLENTATTAHEDFIQAVADGRGLKLDQVREFSDGRIILGSQALKLKLIDGYGDVYEAARMIFDVLGDPLPSGEYPELLYPGDKFKELKKILQMITSLPSVLNGKMSLRYEMV